MAFKVVLLVDNDNVVSMLMQDTSIEINPSHTEGYKAVIKTDFDNLNGICKDDLSAGFFSTWDYDFFNDKVVINKLRLAEIHLESFRSIRTEALKRIDYKLIDATALGETEKIKSLMERKQFLRDYPEMIIRDIGKYSIDYLKSQPNELFI